MQENWLQLHDSFSSSHDYVLATIVNTQGSTYRKIGTMMLVSGKGECTGLLSGGCLEADISLHAQEVLSTGRSKILNYDLKADAELLWGLGLGCDGAIDILLLPLTRANNHLGFAQLLEAVQQGQTGYYCQLVQDDSNDHQATFIASPVLAKNDQQLVNTLAAENITANDDTCWLITPITPVVNLLICGAGPDVVPVVQMTEQLGWRITLQDHRDSHLEQSAFNRCFAKRKLRAEHVETHHFHGVDGVVIMTHNLTADGFLLAKALEANVGYIGLLGPAGRRDKLLNELSLTASDVKHQVFGPIGLDIGGRSPQAIALSICAEIQQQMSERFLALHYRSWVI